MKSSKSIQLMDNSKVTATVTDNGSNFINAFKMLEQSDSDEESEENEEVTFTDVEQTLSTDSDGQFSLPPHLRCASHTHTELNFSRC